MMTERKNKNGGNMKRLILVSALFFVAFGSYAYATEENATTTTEVTTKEVPAKVEVQHEGPGSNIFQIVLGPMINVKDWGPNQFSVGATFGGKYIRLGLGYAHSGSLNAYRPYLLLDIPFTFDVGTQSSFAIGPIVDVGPSFGFINGQKVIDVMMVGFGLDLKFYFNRTLGISLSPVHFSNSFANYTSGGTGWTKGYKMSYDLLFSLLLRF